MRLLLNEQINPQVAAELRKKGYDVVTPNDLGTRGASDPEQLATAASTQRALVTYNIADFQELLMEWSQKDLTHWGIIFISEKTVSQRSIGPLVRALQRLLHDFPTDEAFLNQALQKARTSFTVGLPQVAGCLLPVFLDISPVFPVS